MATAHWQQHGFRRVPLLLAGCTLVLPLVIASTADSFGQVVTAGSSGQTPAQAPSATAPTGAARAPVVPEGTTASGSATVTGPVDVTEPAVPRRTGASVAPKRLPGSGENAQPLTPRTITPTKTGTASTRIPSPPPGLTADGRKVPVASPKGNGAGPRQVVPVSGKDAGPAVNGKSADAGLTAPKSNTADPYQRPAGLRPVPVTEQPTNGPIITPTAPVNGPKAVPRVTVQPKGTVPAANGTATPVAGKDDSAESAPKLLPAPVGLDLSETPSSGVEASPKSLPAPAPAGQPSGNAPVAERLLLAPSEQPKLIDAPAQEEMPLLEEPAADAGESLDLTPEPTPVIRVPTPPPAGSADESPKAAAQPSAPPQAPVELEEAPAPMETQPAPRKLPLLEYLREGEPATPGPADVTPPKSLGTPNSDSTPAKPQPALPRLEVEGEKPADAPTVPAIEQPPVATPPVATPPIVTPPVSELPAPAKEDAAKVAAPPAVELAPPAALPPSVSGEKAITTPAATVQRGPKPVTGLIAPPGFEVTEYAGDGLAHDVYSMTVDAHGRVVVAGPGYIKILIDSDNDGRADRARLFSNLPANGAQGLCFVGNDLLCTGDEGLLRFKDANGDGKADGAPETFLKIETGGEHNAHAIRRGPEGWWYLIAGNTTGVDSRYASLPTSPVKNPKGGVVLRLPPDLSGGEVYADGFRNAYDFEFGPLGDLFVHDSDGERDMSLPWYMPTKLFHVLPGSTQGWITDSWKLPDLFLDAAPVVTQTGRASPTGIVSYRHSQYPEKYRGGLFLLDWTFGRIQFTPATRKGETFAAPAEEFVKTTGEFGFAPTDAEVGADGSLYVCVGGRGTHGTVYRIKYVGPDGAAKADDWTVPAGDASPDQLVAWCVKAPQPSSSWSRNKWVPVAKQAGQTPFLNAAMAEEKRVAERLRAIEILTELHGGLPTTALEILATARAPEVRAHAIWSAGVATDSAFNATVCMPYLADADPRVRLKAVQTLARHPKLSTGLVSHLGKLLGDPSRLVRMATIRLFPELDSATMKEIAETGRKQNWQAAITAACAYTWRQQARNFGVQSYGVEVGRRVLESKVDPELKREAARLLQVALGDLGSIEQYPPTFDGYISPVDLTPNERDLDALTVTLAKVFPTEDAILDQELARVIAMVAPANPQLLEKLLAKITPDSHPTDDVHYLITLARVPAERGEAQRDKIAQSLVDLDAKVVKRGLWIDTNWSERVGELYAKHVEQDEELASRMVSRTGFGRPAHVLFLAKIPGEEVSGAVAAFAREMDANPDYAWNNDTVFTLGFAKEEQYYERVRKQADRYDLRMSAVMVLSESPKDEDRIRFARGLDLEPPEVIAACLTGLEKLPAVDDPAVTARLVKFVRRVVTDDAKAEARDRALAILARDTKQSFGDMKEQSTPEGRKELVEKWMAWMLKTHPQAAAETLGTPESDLKTLESLMAKADWSQGDLAHGKKLYVERGCAQCHAGGRGLGPDLAGITGRFSRDDLFVAIHLPNRDVSPRYQTMMVETKSGKVYTGLVVYEDTDGVMLRNSTNQTQRIEAADIEGKQAVSTSLMPQGLLKELGPQDLADLYAYMKTLGATPIAGNSQAGVETK
jgi:putative membrane-bound dehydrogenase-like protein